MSRRAPVATRGRRGTPAPSPPPSPPPAPPGARARRRGPRVRRSTLVVLVLALVVTGAVLGGRWLLHRSIFEVRHVTVTGLHHETTAQVLAATGLGAHPAMIDVNAGAIERDLQRFPWVARARVVRRWPDTVVVNVTEATAVAVAYGPGHHLDYVSATGRDLGPAPLRANLPTLSVTGARGSWPFSTRGRAAAYVAGRLPRAFAYQVRTITEDRLGHVALILTTPVRFELGRATDLHAKFVAVASVIAHSTLVPGDVIDVTVPGELAVTPPAG